MIGEGGWAVEGLGVWGGEWELEGLGLWGGGGEVTAPRLVNVPIRFARMPLLRV